MKIVVLVKYVPEPTAAWHLTDDLRLDRGAVEGRLSQLDEYAVERAVALAEGATDTEVTIVTMGSDALATSRVLAAAVRRIGFDLVVTGMASTDAEMSVLPSMLADRLGVPLAGWATELSTVDGSVTVHREIDAASEEVVAPLPAVVSVTDRSGEPRYPSFKAIMAARKKTVQTWSLADLDIEPGTVGLAASGTEVLDAAPRPPRAAGTVIVDEGDGAVRLADFLAAASFL